jgi:hypothetical protein
VGSREIHRNPVREVAGVVATLDPVPPLVEASERFLRDVGTELSVAGDQRGSARHPWEEVSEAIVEIQRYRHGHVFSAQFHHP